MQEYQSRCATIALSRLATTLVGAGVLVGWTTIVSTAAATRDYTVWQEIVVTNVGKLENASANCDFKINDKQLGPLLESAGLTLDMIHAHPGSVYLQQMVAADASSYRANHDAACSRAWDTYGDEAVPGTRDLLVR